MGEPALAKGMAVDEKVKKRLVGAVVLVSLGVIFIPMLLEERTPSRMPTFGSNVPAEPESRFETLDIPLQLPEPPAQTRQTVVETEAEAVELENAVKAEQAPQEQKPEPASDPGATAQAPRKKATRPAAEAEPAPKPAPAPKSAARPVADGPRGWVVQVGSFVKPANAFGLRDRIRSKGFPAFVEQLRTGGDIAYRVRVGPELSRNRADKLKRDLASGMKLDGLVMSHP